MRNKTEVWLALAVSLFGVGLVYQHHKRKLGKVKDILEVEKAQNEIIALQTERKVLEGMGTTILSDLDEMDGRIAERKRRIVAMHESTNGLDDDAVVDEFARLGY